MKSRSVVENCRQFVSFTVPPIARVPFEFQVLLLFTKVTRVKSSQNTTVRSGFQANVCGQEEQSLPMPVPAATASSEEC